MKFERRPDVVLAKRWDGTIEGATPILSLIGPRYDSVSLEQRIYKDYASDPVLVFYSELPGLERGDVMHIGSWLVIDSGEFKILDNNAFEKLYVKKEDG